MPTPAVRIELLGGLRVFLGECPVERLETRKAAALLARLAHTLGRPQPREVLIEVLWPEEDLEATRVRFRQALASLRRALETDAATPGSVLIADRSEVRLNPALTTADTQEFDAHLREARSAPDAHAAVSHLSAATCLYQGDLLPGYYEEWVEPERERLRQDYIEALCRISELTAELGDFPAAIDAARSACLADHLREDIHCCLMRLYHASGRTAEALRVFQVLEAELREELGVSPSPATRRALAELDAAPPAVARVGPNDVLTDVATPAEPAPRMIRQEPVGGAMPVNSHYYIERGVDARFHEAVVRQDSIVLLKGPRQVGKTSLLARGIRGARAAGMRVVLTDLQKWTAEQLSDPDRFFLSLAESLSDQVQEGAPPDRVWNPRRGWNVNFERFVRRLMGETEVPLLWTLDEADRLFYCDFGSELFALFRAWHNERSLDPDGEWCRLSLAISYATEAHLFIQDLHQSPFNVGTRLTLEDFARAEVEELNRRYDSPLCSPGELDRFDALLGGHPYLVRRGLYEMATEGIGIAALVAVAAEDDGPFGDHLRWAHRLAIQHADLRLRLVEVLHEGRCGDPEAFYRLRAAGLVRRNGDRCRARCGLYQDYLAARLG